MNDIIKDAHRVHEFRGDGVYALSLFLREVDAILAMLYTNPMACEYILRRVIINKIQGKALHTIRTLPLDANWTAIKEILIRNFGIKETYHQLYQEALTARNKHITDYFTVLLNILSKLNEKYEYDVSKPLEFSPSYTEKIILRTFLNNIDANLAAVIINRNITSLREGYYLLESEGLIRDNKRFDSNFYSDNNSNYMKQNKQSHTNFNNKYNTNEQDLQNDIYKQNFRGQQQYTNSTNQNFQQYANRNSGTWSGQNNYNNSRQSNQFRSQNLNEYRRNNSTNSRRNEEELMDTDHVQVDEVKRNEVSNFHITASREHFR